MFLWHIPKDIVEKVRKMLKANIFYNDELLSVFVCVVLVQMIVRLNSALDEHKAHDIMRLKSELAEHKAHVSRNRNSTRWYIIPNVSKHSTHCIR